MDQYSLRQFVIFGERHLRYLIKEFMKHYHTERFHQGLGGQLIKGQPGSANDNGSNGSIVRPAVSEDLQHIRVCNCGTPNIIEEFLGRRKW